MFRLNRLCRSALLSAGLHQTTFNYASRPTKRQRPLQQTRNTTTTETSITPLMYDPNIENFEIEFLHKRFKQHKYYQIKLTEKSRNTFGTKRRYFYLHLINHAPIICNTNVPIAIVIAQFTCIMINQFIILNK